MPNDPMSHGGNGLGPVYNATSCVACHGLGGPGGAGPDNANVVLLSVTPVKSSLPPRIEEIHPGFIAAQERGPPPLRDRPRVRIVAAAPLRVAG